MNSSGCRGLFKLKDVEERIPIDGNRLKYWYSSDGPYRKCFVKIPMGEKFDPWSTSTWKMLSAEFEITVEEEPTIR